MNEASEHEKQGRSDRAAPSIDQVGHARRGYRKKPLIVGPATYVPLTPEDESRAVNALAEMLAPMFIEAAHTRDLESGPSTTTT